MNVGGRPYRRFETDGVVVDFDAVTLSEAAMQKLQKFGRTHGAPIVFAGAIHPILTAAFKSCASRI